MRPTILIQDPSDPRVEAYTRIRERDLVGRHGQFIAEGEVVLRVLAQARPELVESVLLSERRLAGAGPLLNGLPPDLPVYLAAQPVLDAVAGFSIHRGVLALARRPRQPSPAALLASLPERSLVLVLVGTANHDNVGGLFRNAAAFGAAVLLDRASCDPLYRKAIRVSVGGVLTVPFAQGGDALSLIEALEPAGFTAVALSPRGAETISEARRPRRLALVVGPEGPGLPEAVLGRCRTVRIPMAPGFDSLNVATAAGIALHHFAFAAADDGG